MLARISGAGIGGQEIRAVTHRLDEDEQQIQRQRSDGRES
jgi:hypothetical protein